MEYLEFDVKNMAITRSTGDRTALISGAINYFGMHFNFDDKFANIPGGKAVEFSKNRQTKRVDLVDGSCAIPNEVLTDNKNFEMRVISGNTIGTTWLSVSMSESGPILPEIPEEEPPAAMEFVKTESGENAAPYLRASTNGLEYSQDGKDWNSGVSGVPEVKSSPKDALWARSWGDWVRIDKAIEKINNSISEVKVNDTALTPTDGSVNIDLSAYAEKSEVEALQTLTGVAESVSDIDYSTTDISDVITAFNSLLSVLRTRGVISN